MKTNLQPKTGLNNFAAKLCTLQEILPPPPICTPRKFKLFCSPAYQNNPGDGKYQPCYGPTGRQDGHLDISLIASCLV